ncbi:MAG: class I adenylate-forming enzyme family protein [Acidimicrobiales bacterium]
MTTFSGPDLDEVDGIGALTMGGFLAEVVDRFGPNEAVVFDDALRDGETVRWTYADLGREARRIARALVAAGVEPGETVAIVMANRPEALAAIFGAAMVGAVAAPTSTFSPRPELGDLLRIGGAAVVLTQAELRGRRFGDDVAALRHRLDHVRSTAVLGEASWDELLASGEAVAAGELDARLAAVAPDDPALAIFSSGTTSEPKGMLHGHRSPCLQFWLQAGLFGRDQRTRLYAPLPIFWTAGLNTAVGSTLAAGGTWIAHEVFDAGEALRLLERERVTEPYTLPHQTAALAEHPAWADADLSSIRCAYGKGAYARHPSVDPDPSWIMPVGYGLSETCSFVSGYGCHEPREQMKVGNGRLLPGTSLRVIDPTSGEALGIGEAGELAVAGATRMLGYLGRHGDACFDADGFFRTGDAGHVDAEGIVHWTGRRTEMIKTGGANVSPAELEVALRACPPVKLSRVLGVPDDRLGQVIVACIVCRDGATATEADIQAFLRERVAAYKVPKRVLFFAAEEVPMTSSATKVRDEALLDLVRGRLAPAEPTATTAPGAR